MEQKLNRVIRSCLELGDKNPILSIHDQGAGGNGSQIYIIIIYEDTNKANSVGRHFSKTCAFPAFSTKEKVVRNTKEKLMKTQLLLKNSQNLNF